MDHSIDVSHAPQFAGAGYTLEEFINCWIKTTAGLEITISNGKSINDTMFDVQVTTDDGGFVAGSTEDETPDSALATADRIVAEYVAHFAGRRFLCHWGDPHRGTPDEIRSFDSFTDANGYTPESILAVARLAVSETLDLSDPSGHHTVRRLFDVTVPGTLGAALDDNPIKAEVLNREQGETLLACPVDSHVGQLVNDLFSDAAHFLNREGLEESTVSDIISAVVDQAFVWYFG
jgi:hypothetical protein